jgi:hypothetical protein
MTNVRQLLLSPNWHSILNCGRAYCVRLLGATGLA